MLKKIIIKPVDHISQDLNKYSAAEQISLKIAIKYLKENEYNIITLVQSQTNKKDNTTADIVVKLDDHLFNVSVKNKGGAFTFGNLGTGTLAIKNWCTDHEILLRLKIVEKKNLEIRKEISCNFPRFEDISDIDLQNQYRYKVVQCYIDFYYNLFISNRKILFDFLHYLYSRSSDYEIITDDRRKNVISFITNNKKNLYFHITEIFIKNKSIIIEPYFEIRFKSEGGRTNSSIKMNVQRL